MLNRAQTIHVLHKIYLHLLSLLPRAKQYVEVQTHSITKLVLYFAVMSYCLVSRTEKLVFTHYFPELWALFHPKLTEPPISMHHNKQALLLFWHQVCTDCPENDKLELVRHFTQILFTVTPTFFSTYHCSNQLGMDSN